MSLPKPAETVLILGGTSEAAGLAAQLAAQHPDWRVITSLAGRTRQPKPVAGEVRIGGFGGVAGLAGYLRREGVTQLIDATHPFALQISVNARAAAAQSGIPLNVQTRAPWDRQAGDKWIEVSSIDEAVGAIPPAARVLLALGSQRIAPFAARADVHFVMRMVDAPELPPRLPDYQLLLGLPGGAEAEEALLRAHAITHIVCRNSGGVRSYAKVKAARHLGLPVIIISRTPL